MSERFLSKNGETPWGLLTSLDIYECNAGSIRNADHIKNYVIRLCDIINVRRFGDCQVVRFGENERVAGYSMIQLVETSLVSGHFAELTNTAYIDIFSCKLYDPKEAADFSLTFFDGKDMKIHVTERM